MDCNFLLTYLRSLDERQFPAGLLDHGSVLLTGSAGWGIEEGSDRSADLDLLVVLPEEHYRLYIGAYGPAHVLDDKDHSPPVFGQIRPSSWLQDRLSSSDLKWWPLYYWIGAQSQLLIDNAGVADMLETARIRFDTECEDLAREHFLRHCVRKCDTRTSARRGLHLSASIYHSECLLAAMQTFLLVHRVPYPYVKWLPKRISQFAGGMEFLLLCEESMGIRGTGRELVDSISKVECALKDIIRKKLGERAWLEEWWKFHVN